MQTLLPQEKLCRISFHTTFIKHLYIHADSFTTRKNFIQKTSKKFWVIKIQLRVYIHIHFFKHPNHYTDFFFSRSSFHMVNEIKKKTDEKCSEYRDNSKLRVSIMKNYYTRIKIQVIWILFVVTLMRHRCHV